jgi:hypothetical protein
MTLCKATSQRAQIWWERGNKGTSQQRRGLQLFPPIREEWERGNTTLFIY